MRVVANGLGIEIDDQGRLDGKSVPHLLYRAGAEGPYGTQSGGLPTAQLAQLLGL